MTDRPQFTLCEETGYQAERGMCPIHFGDACLREFIPLTAATGDSGAVPDPDSVPSGDSVTLIETISDALDRLERFNYDHSDDVVKREPAARSALLVLEQRLEEAQSASSGGEPR